MCLLDADSKCLPWRVHIPNLFEEIMKNEGAEILQKPLIITLRLLERTAKRASELNDEELNALMMALTLYEVSDPTSPEYDEETVKKYVRKLES